MKTQWYRTATIALFLMIIALIWGIYLLTTGVHSSARTQALNLAQDKGNIERTNFYSEFDRQQRYFSVGGYDIKHPQQYKYVIINGQTGRITIIKGKPRMPYKARQIVLNNQHPKKVTKVALGYYHHHPVWEVTFVNKDKTMGYYLTNFKNTKIVQVINKL